MITLARGDSMHLNKARPLNIRGEAIVLTGDFDLFGIKLEVSRI